MVEPEGDALPPVDEEDDDMQQDCEGAEAPAEVDVGGHPAQILEQPRQQQPPVQRSPPVVSEAQLTRRFGATKL